MRKLFGIVLIMAMLVCTAFTCDQATTIEPYQKTAVQLVNAVRKKGCRCGGVYYAPAPPLKWHDKLAKAATAHAQDMVRMNKMSHRGSNGSSSSERVSRAGYQWRTVGENVAWGFDNPESVVAAWVESPGHCKTMMSKNYTHMGIAKRGVYWALDVASPYR